MGILCHWLELFLNNYPLIITIDFFRTSLWISYLAQILIQTNAGTLPRSKEIRLQLNVPSECICFIQTSTKEHKLVQ